VNVKKNIHNTRISWWRAFRLVQKFVGSLGILNTFNGQAG
jgi:hypothetical protein